MSKHKSQCKCERANCRESNGIAITDGTCFGSPRIVGTRIRVVDILDQLTHLSVDEIAKQFQLTREEVIKAIEWARDYIEESF